MDEFDPAAELGLFPDKTFVCNARGFLTKNNDARELCDRFIRDGAHVFDVLSRYDDLTAYVLGREEATAGSVLKWVVPFLKANGATDHLMHQFCRENLVMMPNAEVTLRYISRLMPTFITTSMYEHSVLEMEERLDAPLSECYCTHVELDQATFGRSESRKLREVAQTIASLRIPKTVYKLNIPMEVDEADVKIIKTLDTVFGDVMPELPAMSLMESTVPMSSHKKAYQLLDIRRQTNIDMDSTFYIGGDPTDFQPLDLVRDSGGAAVSFNGAEFAVRGCNVAIMSKDSTVGAVFAEEFYSKGIQAVYDLANNWDRKYLKNADFPDGHLVKRMLEFHPRKLPEVYLVDKKNVDEIAEKSDKFRKNLLGI